MPPRFAYWTILLEGKPTAFRAHTRDELLPTLRQLQVRHPDAAMLWFARGRLWRSPEEERLAAAARRGGPREQRGPGWRPGGEHRDPRERFKVPRDEKRRRFAAKRRDDPAHATPPPDRKGRPGQRAPSDRSRARSGEGARGGRWGRGGRGRGGGNGGRGHGGR